MSWLKKYVNETGYLKGKDSNKNPLNIIPSNHITTDNMAFPIYANGQLLYPNTGDYIFPTGIVVETPAYAKGGFKGWAYNTKGRNYSPAWGGQFQTGAANFSADSVAHQANKILQYEQLRGGTGGAPLPYYSDPKYMQMLMQNIYPEVKKIMPNASAMEIGEAMDFVFNTGWDIDNKKITTDPRAYALQEYYKKYDKSKLDKEGNWTSRKNPAYSFDKEYNSTIGKLPENERRVLMNKGRDWFYQHRAPKGSTWDLEKQGPHPNYYDTWYGRIWNTNDYQPFNPNNPKFVPKKQNGGNIQPSIDKYQSGGWLKKYK